MLRIREKYLATVGNRTPIRWLSCTLSDHFTGCNTAAAVFHMSTGELLHSETVCNVKTDE